jgi:signal peptidase II
MFPELMIFRTTLLSARRGDRPPREWRTKGPPGGVALADGGRYNRRDGSVVTLPMMRTPTFRIALVAVCVLTLDQWTKLLIRHSLILGQERILIDGFFKLVHWANTGAAWSMFMGNNRVLAWVALMAMLVLFVSRHYFDAHTKAGQVALGLIFGGILGNLLDRLWFHHVIDFLRFYLQRRGGDEIGFPAFNVADSAICVGVGLIFILSWKTEHTTTNAATTTSA